MKNTIIMAALVASFATSAAEVNVGRAVLGSGTPAVNATGFDKATVVDNAKVENNILHAPQYMPNHPTAATIWPRVVEVPCTAGKTGELNCASYNWSPAMGRGEYLFVKPTVKAAAEVKVVEKMVPVPFAVPGPVREVVREVLVEVPVKKKKE